MTGRIWSGWLMYVDVLDCRVHEQSKPVPQSHIQYTVTLPPQHSPPPPNFHLHQEPRVLTPPFSSSIIGAAKAGSLHINKLKIPFLPIGIGE